jgi:hypothetical protein
MTLGSQIQKVRGLFGINKLILVGDRGMITQVRTDDELRDVEGLEWVTDLRSSAIFLRMLACYVEWHMRAALKSLLFDDEDTKAPRADVVAKKRPSPSARAKTQTKRTPDGAPVHSFQTLLKDLATLCRKTIVSSLPGNPSWLQETEATSHQKTILELLRKIPACSQ